jgi:1-acyl-sn-glycerol-3-phosphate acyltransferase
MPSVSSAPSSTEPATGDTELPATARLALEVQRQTSRLLSPLWVPAVVGILRFGFGYRIEGAELARRRYQRILRERRGPLLVCANHLTMIDSAIIAWALGSPAWYVRHFSAIPWNLPERRNFAYSPLSQMVAYLLKCLPITRGGARDEVADVLQRFIHLLSRGDVGLLFPEGGRSRSGRVDVESAAPGVGRVVGALPRCTVLCVYLRGAHQDEYSRVPARGERFRIRLETLTPRTRHTGLRGSRDIARQIVARLAAMEEELFNGRKRRRGSGGSRNRVARHASAV